MLALGWRMVRSSPHREAIERRLNEEEERWREIQRELLERHGK